MDCVAVVGMLYECYLGIPSERYNCVSYAIA